jgi:hypothetical protein
MAAEKHTDERPRAAEKHTVGRSMSAEEHGERNNEPSEYPEPLPPIIYESHSDSQESQPDVVQNDSCSAAVLGPRDDDAQEILDAETPLHDDDSLQLELEDDDSVKNDDNDNDDDNNDGNVTNEESQVAASTAAHDSPSSSSYKGGSLVCSPNDCNHVLQQINHVLPHWRYKHKSRSLIDAVFMEERTGQRRGLFDLFPHVITCLVCKTIRNYGEQC